MYSINALHDELSKIAEHWLASAERELAHKVMKTPGAIAKATPGARKDVYRTMDKSALIKPGKTVATAGGVSKLGGAGHAAVDLAGLGILAAPSVQALRGKKMDDHKAHKYELAGLGTLAAGVAYDHKDDFVQAAKVGFNKVKSVARLAARKLR